jgi:hypothetical protein
MYLYYVGLSVNFKLWYNKNYKYLLYENTRLYKYTYRKLNILNLKEEVIWD